MTVRTGIRPALGAGTGALAATLLLAGCGFDLDGPGPAPAPEVTSAPSDASERTLGPDGVGPFRLGMSLDEAEATGAWERRAENPEACMADTGTDGITVGWSGELGVHSLTAENARTPEGIGPGSTYADVRRVHPEPSDPDDTLDEQLALLGTVWTAVPGHPDNMYAIKFDTSRLTHRGRPGSATVQVVVLKLKANERC
ncbi:hypothetical protein [Streptomyces canus]|uniref:hypothetical protein n=1 Tax=Streptomyces canus TaxID=58343 RepID=UPI003CE9D687